MLFGLLQHRAHVGVSARDTPFHVGEPAHVVAPAQGEPRLALAAVKEIRPAWFSLFVRLTTRPGSKHWKAVGPLTRQDNYLPG